MNLENLASAAFYELQTTSKQINGNFCYICGKK